jgi:amino acid adenylation domain-containing protein
MLNSAEEITLITSARFIEQKEYWKNRLSGGISPNPLLLKDEPPGKNQIEIRNLEKQPITITPNVADRLMAITRQAPLTVYIILLAVLKTLIHKYTHQEDILVLSPVYRNKANSQTLNEVVCLRDRVQPHLNFRQLLLEMRKTTILAYDNQDYPYPKLIDFLYRSGQIQYNPFNPGILCRLENIHQIEDRYDPEQLVFSFHIEGSRINGHINYNSHLYHGFYLEQAARHFVNLLQYMIKNIEIPISKIDILSPPEREQLLTQFNSSPCISSTQAVIHQQFEIQAARTPHHIAVTCEDLQISYSQLNRDADHFAARLRERSAGPGTIVGMLMESSVEMITGILSVLKAGAAYLPMSPQHPHNRINYMITDSALNILLSHREFSRGLAFDGEIILLDVGPPQEPSNHLENLNQPGDPAYIIYTSGSTGRPKGVIIEHRSLTAYVDAFLDEFDINRQSVMLQQAFYGFDVFVEELYPVLIKGGRLVIAGKDVVADMLRLEQMINSRCVTIIDGSPLLLDQLNQLPLESLKSVKLFISGGDVLKGEYIGNLLKTGIVYNTYGPTETTVCAAYHRCEQCTSVSEPIGKPIRNYNIYITDHHGNLNPIGVPGELYIAGAGLARGYLNNPQLTMQTFTPHPFIKNTRIYRSGDQARWLPNGEIAYLGRLDEQVKLRGYRIELGEIESKLMQLPQVHKAVVIVREDNNQDKYLCAYIVPIQPEIDQEMDMFPLREHLSHNLPDYMVPSFFVQIRKIPLTLNGKVDRKALPLPEMTVNGIYVPPEDDVECKLVAIWAQVLDLEKEIISVEANFFELGGHSLKATILAARIHKEFNVKISLQKILNTQTIRGGAQYIKAAGINKYQLIPRAEKKEYYPLSSAQKRMYIIHQMHRDGTPYNMPNLFDIEMEVDKSKLETIFKQIIQRHESLRTSFHMVDNTPVQKIHSDLPFEMEYYPQIQQDPSPIIKSFIRHFDLSFAPLLRTALIHTGPKRYIWIVDMHHIISDGISMDILIREFSALYHGEKLPLLALQYKDYSQWQNSPQQKKTIKAQEQFWIKQFESGIPILNLPTDYTRPTVQRFDGDTARFKLTPSHTVGLNVTASKNGATIYMVMLAIYTIFLSKLSNQEDIVVGTPIAGRRHADLEKIIGMFVNTLAMRNFPSPGKTFAQFLKESKKNTLNAFENQETQLEDLVEMLPINRDTGRNPLFDVLFTFQTGEPEKPGNGSGILFAISKNNRDRNPLRISKFDLTLHCVQSGDDLSLVFEYSVNLFKDRTIQRFITYFKTIVSAVLQNPNQQLAQLQIITEEEKKEILQDFNNNRETPFAGDKTIHQLFRQQVRRTPHHLAIQGISFRFHAFAMPDTMNQLTYCELDLQGDILARELMQKGVRADSIVALMIPRSIEMIIAILAIMKAGAAYLPIDTQYPRERINYILTDSNTKNLLTIRSHACDIRFRGQITLVEDITGPADYSYEPVEYSGCPAADFSRGCRTETAYVIYTSGTTGKPKGTMITHRSLVNRLTWMQHAYPLQPGETLLQKTTYTFDVSVWEICWWAIVGARVFLLEPGAEKDPALITDAAAKANVTVIHFVPSMLNLFLNHLEDYPKAARLPALKQVICSGEALSPAQVERFYNILSNRNQVRLANLYGPTEAAIDVSYYDCLPGNDLDTVPIGKPIHNIQLYILDGAFHLQPVGIPGELVISGVGLAVGYINRPQLTREKFITLPQFSHRRFYRTGDLAAWLPDGNIKFLDRIDHQVKIRGFRIELGEIENQLQSHPAIQEAVVIDRHVPGADIYLAAYYVPCTGSAHPGEHAVEVSQLREYLSRYLPNYMIPAHFVQLEAIPLTANGKLDRRALPKPEVGSHLPYAAPENDIQQKLADIWADVLLMKTGSVSTEANFFEIGGHSLSATVMAARIHKEMEVKLTLTQIFKTPTIKQLAVVIQQSAGHSFTAIPVGGEQDYYPLSSAQERFFLLHQINPSGTAYNIQGVIPLQLYGSQDLKHLENTILQSIQRHESLRTSFHIIDNKPVQKINPQVEFSMDYIDVSQNGQYSDAPIKEILHHISRPFDLAQAPLLRAALVRRTQTDYWLAVELHHIISDAVSLDILAMEFKQLLQGQQLPPLKLQYKDYAVWQNNRLLSGQLNPQQDYWYRRYKDYHSSFNLPTDFPAPNNATDSPGRSFLFEIDSRRTAKIRQILVETRTTMFIFLLSAFNILLAKYANQQDIVVSCPTADRPHDDLKHIIGVFINMVALRNFPASWKTFKQFLQEVKLHAIEAYENQSYPFEQLVEKLGITGNIRRNPLTNTAFGLRNRSLDVNPSQPPPPSAGHDSQDEESKPQQEPFQTARLDLELEALESPGKLLLRFDYNAALFEPGTIQTMSRHYKNIIDEVLSAPNIKISQIIMLDKDEMNALKKNFLNRQRQAGRVAVKRNPDVKMEAGFDFK